MYGKHLGVFRCFSGYCINISLVLFFFPATLQSVHIPLGMLNCISRLPPEILLVGNHGNTVFMQRLLNSSVCHHEN